MSLNWHVLCRSNAREIRRIGDGLCSPQKRDRPSIVTLDVVRARDRAVEMEFRRITSDAACLRKGVGRLSSVLGPMGTDRDV